MAKAVFIASSHSDYNDQPGEVYHFPNRQYLSKVEQTIGDWVVFYEGKRGGNRGYNAVQRVSSVVPDPTDSSHSYAILDKSTELSFENYVPRLNTDGKPFETGLPLSGGNNTSAVRLISELDFAQIITAGLTAKQTSESIPRVGEYGFEDVTEPFLHVKREDVLVSWKFRDASFARQVKRAYKARCAISGLELRNGNGRPEVEAAHIIPVSYDGPDTVRNGLALSGTLHWMFDRGLLSIDGDNTILIEKGSVADEVTKRLILPDRKIIIPDDPAKTPNTAYLKWHRENIFKG